MDSYIKETMERYRKDRKKHDAIQKEIEKLTDESNKLYGRMRAYLNLLRDALGEQAVRQLEQEFNAESDGDQDSTSIHGARELPNLEDASITDIVLKVIAQSGEQGRSAAQIVDEVRPLGVGIEHRSTIYGTLSRLKSKGRIKMIGKRYYTN